MSSSAPEPRGRPPICCRSASVHRCRCATARDPSPWPLAAGLALFAIVLVAIFSVGPALHRARRSCGSRGRVRFVPLLWAGWGLPGGSTAANWRSRARSRSPLPFS